MISSSLLRGRCVGEITLEMVRGAREKLVEGPILVQQGAHFQDGSGFGWVHAADHALRIEKLTGISFQDYLSSALRDFDQIWRQQNGRLLLVKAMPPGKYSAHSVVELQPKEGFYGLTTVYPEKNTKNIAAKGNVLVWERNGPAPGQPGKLSTSSEPPTPRSPSSAAVAQYEATNQHRINTTADADVNYSSRALPEVYATGAAPGSGPSGGPGVTMPDWVLAGAETAKGKRLLRRIEGRNPAGLRHVVEYINEAVGVEMRRSRSQTSRKHPAYYLPKGHFTMTRSVQSQINFHEAGHGLKELVEARAPGELDKLSGGWLALTMRPGSMASARNVHEGVAEWLRLRMVDPGAVEGSPREHHGAILPEDIGLTFSKSDEFLTKESATGWPESGNRSPDILLADSLF